jgi:hypothetical protein
MINSVFDSVYFEYGNLLLVKLSPLVKRYQCALKKLTGFETALTSFHIDCTGFSPEIAAELNNDDYLDAHGMNKKFILISMEQTEKDIVSTHFSSTIFTLKQFYADNYKALTSLTARDAVVGELDNKQFKANKAIDVINSTAISIEVDTANDLLKKTEVCMSKVESVLTGDNWDNDNCLEEIIELSRDCGSLLKNDGLPRKFVYKRGHYYTALFGGLYVFNDNDNVTILVEDPLFNPEQHGISDKNVIFLGEEKKVFKFLKTKNWINQLKFSELKTRIGQFETKQLHSVLDKYLIKKNVRAFSYMDEQAVKSFIYDNYEELPSDFYRLERLVNALVNDNENLVSSNEYRWYTHEINTALPNDLYVLLNHLMNNFSTYSYFRLFVYNRKRFETIYDRWSPAKREYIKMYLSGASEIIDKLRSKQNIDLGV